LGDFNGGALLAILGSRSGADLVVLYLLYNALGFAGQPLAGLICDSFGKSRSWFIFGGILSVASVLLAYRSPYLAVLCSGIASAFYHSAGGATAWKLGHQKTLAAGFFAAPGVIGLALGMALGSDVASEMTHISAGGMLLILALLPWVTRGLDEPDVEETAGVVINHRLIGSVVGWLILLAIAARSFAWSMGQSSIFPPEDAVRLALAAAVGKSLAGFLADRFGAGLITVSTLASAAVFLALSGHTPVLFFPAVTCLQAGTAPMMALVFRAWPHHPAFGSGLAQGLAIAVGGAPIYLISHLGPIAVVSSVGALLFAAGTILVLARSRFSGVPRDVFRPDKTGGGSRNPRF
jgi:hypothetical protein